MKTKLKTKRGAVKRFRRTGNGGLKRATSNRRHILTKKSQKRKRQLRGKTQVNDSDMKSIETQLCIK
jgi:large subunit ribosomal protein L35